MTTQGTSIPRDTLGKKLSPRFSSCSFAPGPQVIGSQSISKNQNPFLVRLMQKGWMFPGCWHLCIQTPSPSFEILSIMDPGASLRNITVPEATMLWAEVILSPQGLAQTWQTLDIQIHFLISLEPKVDSFYLKMSSFSSSPHLADKPKCWSIMAVFSAQVP